MRVTQRIEAPAVEPLTTAELQAHLGTDQDVAKLLAESRSLAERWLGRSLMAQSWRMSWEAGDLAGLRRVIRLRRGPVRSVLQVGVQPAAGGALVVMDAAGYALRTGRDEVALAGTASWPAVSGEDLLVVDYTTGAAAVADLDPELVRLVKTVGAYLWKWRGDGDLKSMGEAALAQPELRAILTPFSALRAGSKFL